MDKKAPAILYSRLIAIFLLLTLLSVNASEAEEKERKIAVLPFSFHYASEDVGDVDVGAEVAKVLSKRLAKMPGWAPIDQDKIAEILQREDTSDLSGVQIGRLLGADAILTGQVQAFQFDTNAEASAAAATAADAAAGAASYVPSVGSVPYVGGIAGLASGIFSSATSVASARGWANVVIDAKVLDVYSGKELTTLNGTAKSRKSATNLWGSGGPNSDFLSTSFANCIAGQATFAAADQLCKQLDQSATKIDALAVDHVQGVVTDVDGDLVSVSIGKATGFKTGDRFIVEQDPAKMSNDSDLRVGTLMLTDVGDHTSLAKLIDSKNSVLAGDTIREEQLSINKSIQPLN